MVICSYFQRGGCRFGQNCKNEHINYSLQYNKSDPANDIRQTIALEAEAVLKGKQWILSCVGLTEKPCLPGFEDISPEEVRWSSYQAKDQGNLPQYMQEINYKISEATQKMQQLQNPTPEMIQYLVNLHSVGQTTSSNANNNFYSKDNPFGGSTNVSVFGKSNVNEPTTNLFAQPSNNIFGGNTFGAPNTSVFGANSSPSNSASVFGSQRQPSSTNIFANANNTFTASPNNIFSSATSSGGTNIFAKPVSTFGSSALNNNNNQPSTFSFATAATNSNIFGSVPATNNNPIFGQTPAFGSAPSFQTSPTGGNIFGSAQNNNFVPAVSDNQPLFGQNVSGHIFAPAVQPAQNIFGQATQQNPFGSALENHSTLPAPAQAQPTNLFQINNSSNNAFTANAFLSGANQSDIFGTKQDEILNGVYSKNEDLTAEEIACFAADEFILGRIPIHAPTLQMCDSTTND